MNMEIFTVKLFQTISWIDLIKNKVGGFFSLR